MYGTDRITLTIKQFQPQLTNLIKPLFSLDFIPLIKTYYSNTECRKFTNIKEILVKTQKDKTHDI